MTLQNERGNIVNTFEAVLTQRKIAQHLTEGFLLKKWHGNNIVPYYTQYFHESTSMLHVTLSDEIETYMLDNQHQG